MRKTVYYIVLLLLSLAANSCTYDPETEFRQPDALIVVDGWIEQGEQARVLLTTNAPYFTSIDSASIRDLVLSRAMVTLSDGERSEVLILRKDERYFPPYYYAGNTIFGDTGKIYTISAFYGGKSVTSQTTIPPKVAIDQSRFEPAEERDSLGMVILTFTDPPDEKNYYRIFTKVIGTDEVFNSSFLMAINDQYFNGKQVSFTLFRAPKSLLTISKDDYYRTGDTIVIKLCTMDQSSFDFWSGYQDEVMNATNPFASSMIELKSNITGEGLGIWSGYGFSIDTVFAAAE